MQQASQRLLPLALQRMQGGAAASAPGASAHAVAPSAFAAVQPLLRGYAVHKAPPSATPDATSTSYQQQPPAGAASRQPPRLVIYKGRWIKTVRYCVRAKVFQLLGAAGVAAGLAGLGATDLSLADAAVLVGIMAGSVGGSLSLWYYGRRYVGELSLLEPARDTLRFSVLDVWGNREDVDVAVRGGLSPPFKNMPRKAVEHVCNQLMFPLNCEVPGEGRRQFYVSIVAGQLLQGPLFMQLLMGEYVPPGVAAAAGGGGGGGGGQQQQQQQQRPGVEREAVERR
ncbi:MAG: hypothetical protein J3K34DRAFT_389364 [Monoraphidium minutum]|nr:MAG: hypothetical protein J3K34DRAFT_389364 [Monoraphidium minutum]